MPSYPGAIASLQTVTRTSDASAGAATEPVAVVNAASREIEAIETELGVNPSGASATVVARLDALDTTVSGKQPLDADLTALAALTTTSHGRSLLTGADAAASRTTIGAAATSHTHVAADVTDFAETARDTLATALVAGSNITITPNDGADTITIASTASGSGNKDWFNAYGGTWEATQPGPSSVALLSPTLNVPPTDALSLTSGSAYYFRTRAQASAQWDALALFAVSQPPTVSWQAALYTTDGTRRALATGLTFGDLSTTDVSYAVFSAGYSVTAGTDYYYGVWFSFASGTMSLGGVSIAQTGFMGSIGGSGLLTAVTSGLGSGLPSTATLATPFAQGMPWLAAVTS